MLYAFEIQGGAHPKKNKKTKKTKPIYQFWCSDWFFFFFWGEHPQYIIGHNYHGHYLQAGGLRVNNHVRENKVREVNVRE